MLKILVIINSIELLGFMFGIDDCNAVNNTLHNASKINIQEFQKNHALSLLSEETFSEDFFNITTDLEVTLEMSSSTDMTTLLSTEEGKTTSLLPTTTDGSLTTVFSSTSNQETSQSPTTLSNTRTSSYTAVTTDNKVTTIAYTADNGGTSQKSTTMTANMVSTEATATFENEVITGTDDTEVSTIYDSNAPEDTLEWWAILLITILTSAVVATSVIAIILVRKYLKKKSQVSDVGYTDDVEGTLTAVETL